jgi:hypothetical protein
MVEVMAVGKMLSKMVFISRSPMVGGWWGYGSANIVF